LNILTTLKITTLILKASNQKQALQCNLKIITQADLIIPNLMADSKKTKPIQSLMMIRRKVKQMMK
jgi:hypothetical protein